MIIDEYTEISVLSSNKKWLLEKGYKVDKCRKKILIKTTDLQPFSQVRVRVKCDYCGKIISKSFDCLIKGRIEVPKDACEDCGRLKREDVMVFRYGYKNIFQSPEVVKKRLETFKNKDWTKLTKDSIKKHIELNSDCEFIDVEFNDRRNFNIKLHLKCPCGNDFITTLHAFKYEDKKQCNDCGIESRSKKNHPCWRGGITSEYQKARHSKEYVKWREVVFKRDKYTCQYCGDKKGHNLQAHHYYSFSDYPKLRYDVSNGITLCKTCHEEFHTIFGTKGNTKEDFEDFLNL